MERLTKHCDDFIVMKSSLGYYVESFDTSAFDVRLLMEKLAEYEDLEEQGKLLKLPCKVGDILYFPYIDSVTKEKVISKEKVTEIGLYYRVGNGELSSCSEIGSVIFVDESEAESALQKMNEMEGKE